MAITVTKVVFPNKPHLDPVAAYWLMRRYGAQKYPGIENASLSVWKAGENPPTETLAQWRREGVLSFDIEGGTFDHHVGTECLTVIVARELGIIEHPELQQLLRYVQEDDQAGLHNTFGDFAGVIKALYKRGDRTEDVISYALNIIDALQHKEEGWFIDAKKEFDDKAKIFKIKRGKNKLKLAVITSDNVDVANFAKQEEGMAVIIQKNSRGHVFIFTNAFFRLRITDVVAAIRLRELELAGKKPRHLPDLKKSGKTLDVQNWFFHDSLNAMMNGSAALAETPPTKLPLEEIASLVVFGLSTDHGNTENMSPEELNNYQTLADTFRRAGAATPRNV